MIAWSDLLLLLDIDVVRQHHKEEDDALEAEYEQVSQDETKFTVPIRLPKLIAGDEDQSESQGKVQCKQNENGD